MLAFDVVEQGRGRRHRGAEVSVLRKIAGHRMRISIIIPCWKDQESATSCAAVLAASPHCHEIIIADATPDVGAWTCPHATVLRCNPPGRGSQLRQGAEVASGDLLLFNHADTQLTPAHLAAIAETLTPKVPGGAFMKDLAYHHPRLAWARGIVLRYTRSRGILYGDQSVFVWREAYDAIGGIRPLPLMEDVDFSDRLRRFAKPGKPLLILDPPLRTSMRRFHALGYLRNRLQNLIFIWIYRLRLASPETLYKWYYASK